MGTKNSKEKVKKRNPGKIFETNWKMRSEKQGVFCLRLHDSDLSFNPFKDYRSKYTVENPCDFIHFHKGHLFALELKSTKYKSFSIQREESEDSKMIKLHQINSLVNFSLYDGVEAGFIFNFRIEDDDGVVTEEKCYYMPIENFSNFLVDSGKGSINQTDILLYGCYEIECEKIKVNFNYGVKDLFDRVVVDKEEKKEKEQKE